MKIGNRVIAQSDEAGAWPQLYAATMPDVKGGEYFGPSGLFGLRGPPHRDTPTRAAHDDDVAKRLWDVSEQLTGVTFPLSRPLPIYVPSSSAACRGHRDNRGSNCRLGVAAWATARSAGRRVSDAAADWSGSRASGPLGQTERRAVHVGEVNS